MADFKARRHRLEIPSTPNSDDPAVLKKALDQMKRLVQDEFNRLSTDFYDFKKATFDAGIIPLRGVANIAVTKTEYSMSATWELPDGDEITPTHVRVRILEISPNTWATYSYPKTSWEFNGLTPGTQYTLQIQLVATFETTDTFVSTTRNCPSVPVLRTAESDIKAKVFTTDTGVGPPTDGITNDTTIKFVFPNTDGTPGAAGGSDCYWGYKFQYRTACAWADTAVAEVEVAGNVGDVTIDTNAAPFTTYPNSLFRLAYREVCNAVPQPWVYGEPFMAVDWADTDCLGIVKSASRSVVPYSTADLFVLPAVCQEAGTWLQIVDELTDTEFQPQEPGFKCVEYIDGEWTLIADDTTNTAISNTVFQGLLSGTIAAIANFNSETDFTLAFEIKIPDNSLVLAGGTGAYTIIDIGGKIKAQMIQNTGSYSMQIQVPRDGGGAYVFRADGLSYGSWNSIYYVHDVSEPDGRVLYANSAEVGRSANAIANDFNGITGDVQINTVNDMRIRKINAWDEAVAPDVIAAGAIIFGDYQTEGVSSTGTNIVIPAEVDAGWTCIVMTQGGLPSPFTETPTGNDNGWTNITNTGQRAVLQSGPITAAEKTAGVLELVHTTGTVSGSMYFPVFLAPAYDGTAYGRIEQVDLSVDPGPWQYSETVVNSNSMLISQANIRTATDPTVSYTDPAGFTFVDEEFVTFLSVDFNYIRGYRAGVGASTPNWPEITQSSVSNFGWFFMVIVDQSG